jgi:hypothetical protein
MTDLILIERFFRDKLRPGLQTEDLKAFFASMERQAKRLTDMALLSRRRQKALGLLSDVAKVAEKRATSAKPGDAYSVMNHLRDALDEKEHIDLRELADRWIQHLRPRWTEHLKSTRRLQLPQLSDLKPALTKAPPSLDDLTGVFNGCPQVQPIRERLLVAIVATNPQLS